MMLGLEGVGDYAMLGDNASVPAASFNHYTWLILSV